MILPLLLRNCVSSYAAASAKTGMRRENEVLRDAAAPLIHDASARERFAFIDARRARFGVKFLCRVLITDGANYRAWVREKQKRRDREEKDRELVRLVLEIHTAFPAYGAERVTREPHYAWRMKSGRSSRRLPAFCPTSCVGIDTGQRHQPRRFPRDSP